MFPMTHPHSDRARHSPRRPSHPAKLDVPPTMPPSSEADDRAERRRELGYRIARAGLDLLLIAAVGYVLWWAVHTALN